MATPVIVTGLRALFLVMGVTMLAALIYTISTDGLPFRHELFTPWAAATMADFFVMLFPVVVWVVYKEAHNAFVVAVWLYFLITLGSIATSFYILLQLLKLSPQESAQDPMYHLLFRTSSKDAEEHKTNHYPVVIARIVFTALGCVILATLLYTIFTGGSPSQKELVAPWMVETMIDFYMIAATLSVWVIYKESSLISRLIWVLLLVCFGGVAACAYLVKELFQLSSQDPLYLVLLNNANRKQVREEESAVRRLPLMMTDTG